MWKTNVLFFSIIIIFASLIVSQSYKTEDGFETFLKTSGPFIGVNSAKELGYNGEGIVIGIIDTGIDHLHPDLNGNGSNGKVVGGHNYIDEDELPIDTNGHGTEVAGIIAADGQLKGIAPKSKIYAYKVSDDGESVSSDLIIKAIKQAVDDDVDIINISLGVNRTNTRIDEAVNEAIKNNIVVVVAAGNNGPDQKTIGSPGINQNAITVGATYNNITSSLVATLTIDDNQFQVLPMVGTMEFDEPITSKILFGEYGREKDLSGIDVSDSILLVKRGSDIEGEIVYFSDKEKNAADSGANALLVYNNKPGLFLGELTHNQTNPDYKPRIPTFSMSEKDGQRLLDDIENGIEGTLELFNNPDIVAHFSSRGPVSPFYIKPDLVAPGVYVNTTIPDSKYNITSGTSFATPHVTGAVALLLQKKPDLLPHEIKSILITTTDPIFENGEKEYPLYVSGAGRINLTKALNADLIIEPHYLAFHLSSEKQKQTKFVEISNLKEGNLDVEIGFDGEDIFDFDYQLSNNILGITLSISEEVFGQYEGRVLVIHNNIT